MQLPKRLRAFTLAELLVVLIIAGILMTLSLGFTRRTQDTFVAQQFVKTVLLNTRILRRKSMLISRNSSDSSWVHGIGFKLTKNTTNNVWEMTQQKVLLPNSSSYYYRAYPDETSILFDYFQTIEDSAVQRLSQGLTLRIRSNAAVVNAGERNCLENIESLYVIFESINGKMHAYCNIKNGPIIPLGTVVGQPHQPSLTISIMYNDTQGFSDKVTLMSNGEISTTK
jgi:prepilin-type N-terminal cleavage/methylation domain-containing protein